MGEGDGYSEWARGDGYSEWARGMGTGVNCLGGRMGRWMGS